MTWTPRVGDEVRLNREGESYYQHRDFMHALGGVVGKVIRSAYSDPAEAHVQFRADTPCAYEGYFFTNYLELVKEAPMFKVGDRVDVKPYSTFRFDGIQLHRLQSPFEYRIVRINPDNNEALISANGCELGWMSLDKLTIITDKSTPIELTFTVSAIRAAGVADNMRIIEVIPRSNVKVNGMMSLLMDRGDAESIHIGDEYTVTIARKG